MNELSSLLDQMGNSSTATITMGNVTGCIAKLPSQNQTSLTIGFTTLRDTLVHNLPYHNSIKQYQEVINHPSSSDNLFFFT